MRETKALRVFYRKSDNQIIWTHELRGTGAFPTTIEADLAEIPYKMPDGLVALGGNVDDYACIEEADTQRAINFLASDNNRIIKGKLVAGDRRVVPEPPLHRDLVAEIDEIKARVKELEKK